MHPPFDGAVFDKTFRGTDTTAGRFADVSVTQCSGCGRHWLHYHYENEAVSRSGRWYRGLISKEQAETVTAEGALELLKDLPWHLFGGSYYDSDGKRADWPLDPVF